MTSMQDHWERHAGEWIRWARTPGYDFWHSRFNWPRFQELLPPPGRLTVDLGCGEGRLLRELGAAGARRPYVPKFLHVRALKPGAVVP
jgi:hypothetical protein